MLIKCTYHSTKKTPSIYKQAWRELIDAGHHAQLKSLEVDFDEHVIIAKHGGKHIGLISFMIDTNCVHDEAVVTIIYVKPEYRMVGVATSLHNTLVKSCKHNSVKIIRYCVADDNYHAKWLHAGRGLVTDITYSYEVDNE